MPKKWIVDKNYLDEQILSTDGSACNSLSSSAITTNCLNYSNYSNYDNYNKYYDYTYNDKLQNYFMQIQNQQSNQTNVPTYWTTSSTIGAQFIYDMYLPKRVIRFGFLFPLPRKKEIISIIDYEKLYNTSLTTKNIRKL